MLSINISELIWTIINFFLLYFVLRHFLFDPVGKLLDERQAKIDAGQSEAKKAQETVQALHDRLAEEKAESRLEAGRILAAAESEGEKRRSEAVKAARTQAADNLRAAAAHLKEQDGQEEALLRERSGELSALLSGRILGQED